MLGFLQRQWFLVALVVLIAAGTSIGASGNAAAVKPMVDLLNPTATTACVLFLMSFSLETGKLWTALKSPASVGLGFAMNFGLIPLIAWGLRDVQRIEDFRLGLMVAASVPSTLAAAAVITRRAGGNDAVSLLITLVTNLSCFVMTPLWLKLTTGEEIPIKTFDLMINLLLTVLLPTMAGQGLRLAGQFFVVLNPLHDFATYRKQQIGIVAQSLIVAVVFTAALRAGVALHTHGSDRVPLLAVVVVLGSSLLAHIVALFAGLGTAHALRMPAEVASAVGFAGSQKTLPIGVYISSLAVFENYPFVMLPILLFHVSQLFLDTVVASHLSERAKAGDRAAIQASGVSDGPGAGRRSI